jgi:tRNA(Ile)-lysidine synthase
MIIEKVKRAVKKYRLIEKGETIIVGVSGGPDSVALLYSLNSLKQESGIKLHVAHLDHMLRPCSFKDAEFVKGLAGRLKLPVTVGRANLKKTAGKGSLEEAYRNARLEFLFRVARRQGAKKIALGHNLDDQAETVLMRLIRGAGLYGLSAILPKRKIYGFMIIRPLIEVRRKEIEAYLKRKKIGFCVDETNKQDIYFRNKLRNRLLPLLEREYNKNIKEILSNTALSVGYDYDYLAAAACKLTGRWGKKINLAKFRRLHPAMQNLALRSAIARLKGDTRRITFKHIEEINDLIFNRPSGSVVDLPKNISVIKKKNCLIFLDIT